MLDLDLRKYRSLLRLKTHDGKKHIFSPLRKRWLKLTPEEMVRQLLVEHFLHCGYPVARISEEKQLSVFGLSRRYDLVVFDKKAMPFMLVECKAPQVPISQHVFDQIARYNLSLKVPYLLVTNGIQSFCCKMDYKGNSYTFVNRLPDIR